LSINGSIIDAGSDVRDLGVYFDSTLKMEAHIRSICKKAYYQINLISKVRNYISEDSARILDYCNGLLYGLPNTLLKKLQRVQNYAARIIKQASKSAHVTPLLKKLHWLPVQQRIEYKIILLTFRALNGLAPPYIMDLLSRYMPSRTLRSMNGNLLKSHTYKCKAFGGRSFSSVAPNLWNGLPSSLRAISDEQAFKRALKTHLFKITFDWLLPILF
jgi:hypothetical protein